MSAHPAGSTRKSFSFFIFKASSLDLAHRNQQIQFESVKDVRSFMNTYGAITRGCDDIQAEVGRDKLDITY